MQPRALHTSALYKHRALEADDVCCVPIRTLGPYNQHSNRQHNQTRGARYQRDDPRMNAGGIGDSRLGVNHEVTVGTEPTPRFTPTPDTSTGVARERRVRGPCVPEPKRPASKQVWSACGGGVPSPFTLLPLG